ncbi:hypothetical protein ALC60_07524 [Trachymyrmex zeteki]|uniref:Uncharacterized protein n=1 Tax=Mycetomoellerius zeteki TaxID=64791 RepID=A0A151WZK5_9HYME|nr:hypothetical protein ALC60_07524 [Trachymyrmex zeteki]
MSRILRVRGTDRVRHIVLILTGQTGCFITLGKFRQRTGKAQLVPNWESIPGRSICSDEPRIARGLRRLRKTGVTQRSILDKHKRTIVHSPQGCDDGCANQCKKVAIHSSATGIATTRAVTREEVFRKKRLFPREEEEDAKKKTRDEDVQFRDKGGEQGASRGWQRGKKGVRTK